MNAPLKVKPTHYYLVRCKCGAVLYEYGTSEKDVQAFMKRSFPWYEVDAIELIK